jgi:hypothetical protein
MKRLLHLALGLSSVIALASCNANKKRFHED